MQKSFAISLMLLVGSVFAQGAFAVTSTPMPEEGFAVASNNQGGEGESRTAVAAPTAIDAMHRSGPAGGSDSTDAAHDTTPVEPTKPVGPEHVHAAAPADGTAATTPRKARPNTHWQSLLPGVMK